MSRAGGSGRARIPWRRRRRGLLRHALAAVRGPVLHVCCAPAWWCP